VRFLPADDERVVATVLAIADELSLEGLVLRYRVEETDDGLAGHEGTFTICSFWLVAALVEIGELDRARALCERLLSHASPLGLYAEEIDPRSGRHLGNSSGVHPSGPDQRRDARHPGRRVEHRELQRDRRLPPWLARLNFPPADVLNARHPGNSRPMAGKRSSGSSGMTRAHKEALATGRNESRVVRRYLEALSSTKPRRGRRRTVSSVEKRLAAVEAAMETAMDSGDRITTLKLSQERLDLMNELENLSSDDGIAELEADFVAVAANYGNRQGISYAAWREVGVQPDVLRRAGITRSA
jgi:hypothetical protein